jgi:ABC-type phosphate transport system substrate-binding protein
MLGIRRKNAPGRRARASLLAGTVVAALGFGALSAGSAVAAPLCEGGEITGQGSSLQKIAQETWTSGYAALCPSHAPIKYNSTGSGAGLKEWNFTGEKGSINTGLSFIGTDDAPTTEQINNTLSVSNGANVVTIPVSQTAIVPVINPPANCTITALTNKDLENIFRGIKKTWSSISTAEGSGCSTQITRVVRKEGSGTSYQFKNYLSSMNAASLPCIGKTWLELRPVGAEEKPNISWPESCEGTTLSKLVRPEATGGGALVKQVNAIDGAVGYASLPDVMNNKTGDTFPAELQNNGQVGAAEATFASPIAAGSNAACSNTKYGVPLGARFKTGEPVVNVSWASVFGANPKAGGANYPLCTLTYIMSFDSYSKAGFKFAQYASTRDFVERYVTKPEGQTALGGKYYAPLPTAKASNENVSGASQYAAGKIRS